MARKKIDTGNPTPYSREEEAQLAQWLKDIAAMDADDEIGDYAGFDITADVEWAGTFNPRKHRTLSADNLDLREVKDALSKKAASEGAERLRTYKDTRWDAQLRTLQGTRAGREALAREVSASARTQRGWSTGKHQPTRANREAIARAYEARATDPAAVARANTRSTKRNNRGIADAFSRALTKRFETEIRLTKISDFRRKK